jgi:GNAT superfamily N-acetyltransferase
MLVTIAIEPIQFHEAGEADLRSLNGLFDILREEIFPEDPPESFEHRRQGWLNLPDFSEVSAHVVWDAGHASIIAYADITVNHTGDNENVSDFNILVHPQHRHKGIARRLLREVASFARLKERTLLITMTSDRIPAGDEFMRQIGARKGIETRTSQLKVEDLPQSWVEKWLEAGEMLSTAFEMILWDGPIPEEHMQEMTALLQVLYNSAPVDRLEIESHHYTVDMLRQWEKNLFAQGYTRWTLALRDCSTGKLAGMTEIFWNRDTPMIVGQGFTGVLAEYRGRGLGHWLKAAMVRKVVEDHPETRILRTGNANSNEPMLKINREMGFQPYIEETFWQVDRVKVEEYLSGCGG